jgi:hypothetical protein
MAITLSPLPATGLTAVTRDTNFTQTVTATGGLGETVNSVVISGTGVDSGITLNGATISGQYNAAFNEQVYYVTKGSSDLLETPTIVNGTGNVPPNKDIIKFVTDNSAFKTKSYTVTVTYNTSQTQTFTLTQQVNNDMNGFVSWLTGYLNA